MFIEFSLDREFLFVFLRHLVTLHNVRLHVEDGWRTIIDLRVRLLLNVGLLNLLLTHLFHLDLVEVHCGFICAIVLVSLFIAGASLVLILIDVASRKVVFAQVRSNLLVLAALNRIHEAVDEVLDEACGE